MLKDIFYFLIYPGLLFAGSIGAVLSWYDRKMTAMVQFRKGPPFLQSFYDFLKLLLVKETILPARGSKPLFLLSPLLGLTGASVAATMILLPMFGLKEGFSGDILVIFYLLAIPSISFMLGALATGNPMAAIGASREMKLIISYELTFLLVLLGIVFKSGMHLRLSDILQAQSLSGPFIGSLSGILLLIAAFMCVQAKLGFVPFDMAEAEAEINHGAFIELSGIPYALVRLTKYILLFSLPALLILLFLNGMSWNGIHILWSVLKILGTVLILTLIRNTNPRVKIHQAMRFFFVWMNFLVVAAWVLIYFGL